MADLIHTIGLITVSYVLYKILDITWTFLRPSSLPKYLRGDSKDRTWALVTGASDGIGKGFAFELAHRGFNVILHGRNRSKLESVLSELQSASPSRQFRIAIAHAQIDAHDNDNTTTTTTSIAAEAQKLVAAIQDLPISILINNVGGSGRVVPVWRALAERTADEVDALIDLNARFMIHVTRLMIPVLHRSGGPSLIMTIGSEGGRAPVPWNLTYGASKAFDAQMSASLRCELRAEKMDIEVLHIGVGMVQASKAAQWETGWFVPTGRRFAAAALDRVGCGKRSVTAFFPHAVQTLGYLLPEWALDWLVTTISRQEMVRERKSP